MKLTLMKVKREKSRYGGHCFGLFFRSDEGKSYRSWLYPFCNNFVKWKLVLESGEGTEIENLKLKTPHIVDADSEPRIIRKREKYSQQGKLL